MAHGLSCPTARGVFPDRRPDQCPLQWWAGSSPLSPREAPPSFLPTHPLPSMTLPCDAPAVSQDPPRHPHPSLQATGRSHKWPLVSLAPSRAGAPEMEVGVATILTISIPFDDFLGQWLSTLLARSSSLQTQCLTPSFFRISPWCGRVCVCGG